MRSLLTAGAFALTALVLPIVGRAEADPCALGIHRGNVGACALRGSPLLRERLAARDAAVGRREAARPFLPSNPVVSGSLAARRTDSARDTNWSLSIGQQIEIAGQRGLRIAVADRELAARGHDVAATRLQVTAQAWTDYFIVLATRERVELARRLEVATNEVAGTVVAMAAKGVASDVDADIADAAALSVTQDRLRLEAALEAARAELAIHVGGVVNAVEGDLEPIKSVAIPAVAPVRPELLALDEERTALENRVSLLGRERMPAPTVSLLAQDDGFNERVLGVGLSLPIPLPQPVGRTFAGEISEATAMADGARAAKQRLELELRAEVTAATADLAAARQARTLHTAERTARIDARLASIASQVKAGRLAVRDALIAQQALVSQLKSQIDAREWLCVASVRLARAVGLSLEGEDL